MASNPHSDTTLPWTRPKGNRVTAQHTLDRVRNNQRRHRARRRDYIETLQQKLSQAEQSVRTLQDQINALQLELAQRCNQDRQIGSGCPVHPGQLRNDHGSRPPVPLIRPQEISSQASGLLPKVTQLGRLAPPTLLPVQLQLFNDLSNGLGPELVDAISPYTEPKDADRSSEVEIPQVLVPEAQPLNYTPETLPAVVPLSTGVGGGFISSACSTSDLALQTKNYQVIGGTGTLLSATATSDPIPTTTETCCSDGNSSKPDNRTDDNIVVPSPDLQPLLPRNILQPAMGACNGHNTETESTMLCAEAYLLVEQQNFKGVSQKDIATWLWHGFRKSSRHGEGCRVKTDLLFSLLVFISDP